ncbi:MAG: manganese efflux pump, partial [Lachnospiraceae bacterium]|nr:manganese efflux pump [Lachnospiraceae bacterium]
MSIVELFLIAVGLSMDAFAVAICKGLTLQKMSWKGAVITGIYFGGFQGLMPVIGYFLGYGFRDIIEKAAHLIAFVLLLYIGGSMIKESTKEEREMNDSFSPREMLPLALATSIDALMTGVTFAFLNVSILPA